MEYDIKDTLLNFKYSLGAGYAHSLWGFLQLMVAVSGRSRGPYGIECGSFGKIKVARLGEKIFVRV